MVFDYAAATPTVVSGILGSKTWDNPAEAAMPYLEQIKGTITPYFDPYIQAGQTSLDYLTPYFQKLAEDPASFLNQLGTQFQASPGYSYNIDQATKAANAAAAAGGMVGSPAEQQALATVTSGLASQDYNNWMNNVLRLLSTGAGGMQGISNTGFQAASSLAENLANALMSQAALSYSGTMAQNQASGGLISDLAGSFGF